MYKNLNKFLIRLMTVFITIFSLLLFFDYLKTKNITPEIRNEITITNSIQSDLLSTYFSVNIENSKVFNKYNLKNLDKYSFKISYKSKTQKEDQKKRNEILDEIKIIKNEISEDVLFLINMNEEDFLNNYDIAVVYSVIKSGKDFIHVNENQNIFNMYSYIRYIYYLFISFIVSILLLLGIKLVGLNKNHIDKFFKNLV